MYFNDLPCIITNLNTTTENHGDEIFPVADLKVSCEDVPIQALADVFGNVVDQVGYLDSMFWMPDGLLRTDAFGPIPLPLVEFDNMHIIEIANVSEQCSKVHKMTIVPRHSHRVDIRFTCRIVEPEHGTVERLHEAVKHIRRMNLIPDPNAETDLLGNVSQG